VTNEGDKRIHKVPRFELPFPCLDVVRDALGLDVDTRLRVVQKLKTEVFCVTLNGTAHHAAHELKFARYCHLECHTAMADLGLTPDVQHHWVVLDWHTLIMEDLKQYWLLYYMALE